MVMAMVMFWLQEMLLGEQTVMTVMQLLSKCKEGDGIVTSCGGSLSDDEIDDDGDGFVECTIEESGWLGADDIGGGDCDDTPATTDDDGNIIDIGGTKTHPGAAENEIDLITDGICVSDNDGDGYAPIELADWIVMTMIQHLDRWQMKQIRMLVI